MVLAGKRVVLGVTGGIAAYKALELVSAMIKAETQVDVIMTRAAQEFVTPLSLSALTGRPVLTQLFDGGGIPHIEVSRRADLLLIVPATANIIGKIAGGIADDLLTTTILATSAPVLICPAMNSRMYRNPLVQKNIQTLKGYGYHFEAPESGRLACGEEGDGRLAGVDRILTRVRSLLGPQDFQGCRVLVTAGPTREPIDPVRFIANRSSGRMGYAVAQAAVSRGAEVVLVSGPTALAPPSGVTLVRVETAQEMLSSVLASFPDSDIVIKAAAVADYRPHAVSRQKIKKRDDDTLLLELDRNPDILAALARQKGNRLLVGFAAETENLEENAAVKALTKGLDLVVANDVTVPGAGFEVETNTVSLVYPEGRVVRLPQMDKLAVAHHILDAVLELRRHGGQDG